MLTYATHDINGDARVQGSVSTAKDIEVIHVNNVCCGMIEP